MKKTALWAALIAGCDQAIKAVIRRAPQGHVFFRLDGVVEFTHSTNTGAAFSMLSGRTALITALSALLLAALVIFVHRTMRLTRGARAALTCLIGGGVGNLIDRLFFAGVTDYIRILFFRFPVFNLADIMITLSIAALVVLLFTGRMEEPVGERHGSDH